jgi:hypothetical protein
MTESPLPSSVATLAVLRSAGAQRLDPVRFHYLEVLSGRLHAQPEAVRRILQGRLDAALAHYQDRLRLVQANASSTTPVPQSPGTQEACGTGLARLVALNRDLNRLDLADLDPGAPDPGMTVKQRTEMKSVRQFKTAWSRNRAQDQVTLAVAQGPDNAGPLNSHNLVLRSMALMRSLSPDYLQRFLSHAESLLWLDQLNLKQRSSEPRPSRKTRRKA